MTLVPQDKDNSVYSFMGWQTVTNTSSSQYTLRERYKKTGNKLFDPNGLADIFGRKVIACVSRFGNVGEEVEVTFKNPVNYWNPKGTLFAIIGDIKSSSDSNNDGWGHLYTNGTQRSVVEFIVDGNVFKNKKNIKSTFPGLKNNPVIKIEKTGVNFFDKI